MGEQPEAFLQEAKWRGMPERDVHAMTADTTPNVGTTNPKAEDGKQPEKVDLRNLQDKFHLLLDQRNAQNDAGKEARDTRNLLNDQRRERSEELDKLKTVRDAANAKMREHKELRNSYQDQAKALIAEKKGQKGGLERSLPLRVRKLKNDIENSLERQETQVMTIEKERTLVDSVRHMRHELEGLEEQLKQQAAVKINLDDSDLAIDQLFKEADLQHEKVQEYNKIAREHHDKFVDNIKEIRIISKEADDKHKAFIAIRKKADELHHKAMELREQMGAIRGERKAEYDQQKGEIRDVNRRAGSVTDPKAIAKANDSALDALKKGGKISLGF